MNISHSLKSRSSIMAQRSSPKSTLSLQTKKYKLTLALSILTSLLSTFGLIYFYLQARSAQLSPTQKTTEQNQKHTTSLDRLLAEEVRVLNYFNTELQPKYNNIIQLPPGQMVRRVSSIDGDSSWIVETSNSVLEPQNRSIIEERNFYLLSPTNSIFVKLNSEPQLCFVDQAKKISLPHSRLLISGPCNIGYFTNLYSYSDEQIDFIPLSDPNNLIATHKFPDPNISIINDDKSSRGKLSRALTSGEESVFVVDIGSHYSMNQPNETDRFNPTQGLAIFDVNTGALKDLIIYSNY